MIRIQQLKLSPSHTEEDLKKAIGKQLKIKDSLIFSYKIIKRSIDARKKDNILYIYTIDAEVSEEDKIIKKVHHKNIMIANDPLYKLPVTGEETLTYRPVIIGAGPAGLFCGLFLARLGYRPILLERGEDVDSRKKSVDSFWKAGNLNPNSNVQFGEGGAGTFSDGKLNTLVKDITGRNRKVLEVLAEAGAPSEILYLNKPHIGTDILSEVVKKMRMELIDLGGEVRFLSHVTDINIENKKIKSVIINGQEELLTQVLVLAVGHSARDTFQVLEKKAVPMEKKSFAVGVRIEHPQELINVSQYGKSHHLLPAAEYKVTTPVSTGRSVYSFCMCPGGYVVNSSSEEGHLAVNGMSYHNRDGNNANSAIIVTVTPADFPSDNILAGVEFQQKLEAKAYELGAGKVPVQLFGDFCENKDSSRFYDVHPCIKGDYAFTNLRELFTEPISLSIIEGITEFGHKIRGFSRKDAVLSGVESRTSSPLRILRDEKFESVIEGLYPCGEGAGYAGGITSAAMDGIKVFEAIAKRYQPL